MLIVKGDSDEWGVDIATVAKIIKYDEKKTTSSCCSNEYMKTTTSTIYSCSLKVRYSERTDISLTTMSNNNYNIGDTIAIKYKLSDPTAIKIKSISLKTV